MEGALADLRIGESGKKEVVTEEEEAVVEEMQLPMGEMAL